MLHSTLLPILRWQDTPWGDHCVWGEGTGGKKDCWGLDASAAAMAALLFLILFAVTITHWWNCWVFAVKPIVVQSLWASSIGFIKDRSSLSWIWFPTLAHPVNNKGIVNNRTFFISHSELSKQHSTDKHNDDYRKPYSSHLTIWINHLYLLVGKEVLLSLPPVPSHGSLRKVRLQYPSTVLLLLHD